MKLSIITINFNDIVGLEKTIKSVINQTYKNYEFIIIDGGSTDGSKDIIDKYKEYITYWVSEPDKGIYNAMNKGIAKANGEYLHFLNSADCYYSDDVLEFCFKDKTYDVSLLRGIQVSNFPDGEVEWHNNGTSRVTFYNLYTDTILHQATFIEKKLFSKYGFFDENYRIVSDWLFFAKAILGGEDTCFLEKKIVLWDVNGISSDMSKTNEEKNRALLSLFPQVVLDDYKQMEYLLTECRNYHNDAIVNFVKTHKFPQLIMRVLRKFYLLLGIK